MGMWLSVGLGGFFGAILRVWLSSLVQKVLPFLFPFGTLMVNVIGSFAIGFLALYFEAHIHQQHQKMFWIAGMLGGLTTFSTFSLQSVEYLMVGEYFKGAMNILLNVVLCCVAVVAGMMLFKRVYG